MFNVVFKEKKRKQFNKFSHFRCYPLNTVLADPHDLDRKLREYYQEVQKSRRINDDSDSDSDSSSSSDSDSDSDSSDSSDVRDTFHLVVQKNAIKKRFFSFVYQQESSDSSEDDKPLSQIKPIIDDKPKEKPIPKVAKADRNKCYVCKGLERCNSHQKPELFISCSRCDRNGEFHLHIHIYLPKSIECYSYSG